MDKAGTETGVPGLKFETVASASPKEYERSSYSKNNLILLKTKRLNRPVRFFLRNRFDWY